MTVADNDEINHSRMPLMDHLIELRLRLIYCFAAFILGFAICSAFASDIYDVLLTPYKIAVGGETRINLIYTALEEYFFVKLRCALFGALILSFPVLASQVYIFVAPGLYKNERQAFLPFLIASPILFFIGGALVLYVIMPLVVNFFLSMQQVGTGQVEIKLAPKISEYLNLIMTFIKGVGLCFQTPVILTLLARAGFITSDWLIKKWRYAVVFAFVVAAVLAPPDAMSMTALALPTFILYGISIFAVKFIERRREAREKREAAEEE